MEPHIQSASMSRDTTGGRCRLTDSFPSAPPGGGLGLASSNRVGPGNNQSVVSERGDTAHLIDQGRFTKGTVIVKNVPLKLLNQ